MLKKSFC